MWQSRGHLVSVRRTVTEDGRARDEQDDLSAEELTILASAPSVSRWTQW
jgi:hypothetical protein